jgi:hypothetical protein
VYFGVQFRNGQAFLIVDERFVVEVPFYAKDSAAVENFLINQGISSDLAKVAAKLKLSLLDANASLRQYKDEKSFNGVNIGKSKDGLPGITRATSEPGDELGGDETIDNANSGTNNKPNGNHKFKKSGDGSKGKPKPEIKGKSDQELTADAKAGIVEVA